VAAVTGHATQVAAGPAAPVQEMTREESERRQSLWWYLLLAGLLLLAARNRDFESPLAQREVFIARTTRNPGKTRRLTAENAEFAEILELLPSAISAVSAVKGFLHRLFRRAPVR
jgi:hypothetical protein